MHVYFDIDPGILWDTVQHDLPKLVDPLKKLLGITVVLNGLTGIGGK